MDTWLITANIADEEQVMAQTTNEYDALQWAQSEMRFGRENVRVWKQLESETVTRGMRL